MRGSTTRTGEGGDYSGRDQVFDASPPGSSGGAPGLDDFRVVAVGRKPDYHLARDCLSGSLFRSRLPSWFHAYSKAPPRWLEDKVAHLPVPMRAQAAQHVAIHHLHLRHLGLLAAYLAGETEAAEARLLERMRLCWPSGVQVEYAGRGEPSPCGLAWLCPWCHARNVVGIHRRLLAGPLRRPEGVVLLQGRASVNEVDLEGPEWGYGVALAGRVRDALGGELLSSARRLGVLGGILTFRVGVEWWDDGRRFRRFELGVLGEVAPDAVARHRAAFEGRVDEAYSSAGGARAAYGDRLDGMWPVFGAAIGPGPAYWTLLPAAPGGKQPVPRLLLAGSGATYSPDRLGLYLGDVDATDPRCSFQDGVPGVLAWEPAFLLGDADWLEYQRITKGRPLYRPFGTWRQALAVGAPRRRTQTRPPLGRRQARGDEAALARVNAQRRRARADRLAELSRVAGPLWPEVLARCEGRPGRPAHRAVMAEVLAEKGVLASARDLKALLAARRLGQR